ncbi:MAG: shikimate kinase [Atopobium sp.]|nr:shikimate kinase [Atopobium sp.]
MSSKTVQQASSNPTAPLAPYGLIGEKLSHSWSAEIHEKLGSFPYQLHELSASELKDFLKHQSWRGLNVTIPYKKNACALADSVSEDAQAIGAANTLVKDTNGLITADNTDVYGFEYLVKSLKVSLNQNKAIVLGAFGGAGQAVCYALKKGGAYVVGVSRNAQVSSSFVDCAITYDQLQSHYDADLLVNATPIGMSPHAGISPLTKEELASFTSLQCVIDLIYNPLRSQLLLDAESLGILNANGLKMLVAQAAIASSLFLGRDVSDSQIERISRDLHASKENIVLIGMPGVGKTSTGEALAKLLNRPWIDTDLLIKQKAHCEAATYLQTHGEAAFRRLEHEVIQEISSMSGAVISCGGGVVVTPSNYQLLRQNGKLVYLTRPLEELTIAERPLSQSVGIQELAAKRLPLYEAWADVTFSCLGSPEADAKGLLAAAFK